MSSPCPSDDDWLSPSQATNAYTALSARKYPCRVILAAWPGSSGPGGGGGVMRTQGKCNIFRSCRAYICSAATLENRQRKVPTDENRAGDKDKEHEETSAKTYRGRYQSKVFLGQQRKKTRREEPKRAKKTDDADNLSNSSYLTGKFHKVSSHHLRGGGRQNQRLPTVNLTSPPGTRNKHWHNDNASCLLTPTRRATGAEA